MAAIKALQQWCKIQCEGYRDVTVSNMTTSFRDGLAFCALIHKFRPDLINFESLSKDNVYYNNHLAFCVADEHLGIPALLDAEDMVALPVPDRLSILTYVSQYYNYFNGRSPIGGVGGGVKRHAEVSKEVPSEKKNLPVVAKNHYFKTNTENHPPKTEMPKFVRDDHPQSLNIHKTAPEKRAPATQARQAGTEWPKRPGTKSVQTLVTALRAGSSQSHRDAEKKTILMETSNKSGTLKSECTVCGNHVHLVQRHLVDGKLYHRNCFKCSVCYGTLKSGAFKLEADHGSLVCSVHQHAQTAFNPTVKPFKNSGVTLSEQTPKSETAGQPSSQRFTSLLSTPIIPLARPANLCSATQSWTVSAQRTQEARQKFFQSCGSAADHRPTARQPSEISTDQNAGLKVVYQDRTNATINWKLPEGNSNNNNALNSDTGTQRQPITSESSSWRQELHSRGVREMKLNQATPSSPAISCSLSTTESLYRSAISTECTRPPSLQLSTAKAQGVQSCEALADRRSKPKAPNGPRLKKGSEYILYNTWLGCELLSRPDIQSCCLVCRTGLCLVTDLPLRNHLATGRRAQIKPHHIPADQITKELQDIEYNLNDLENKGVELEWRLRVYEEEGHGDLLMDPLMVDWFNLIQKKQGYIRRESELMYIVRTQDLEEQQPGVEGELRRLINKPEHLKSLVEKKRESELLNRLMEIVNDRNAIVEGLEEDRLREGEEDQQLNEMMQRLGLRKFKNKRKSSFSKLFRLRSKKASIGE
ncbi:MICAL-like protein 2 [Triplophysa tibetana]|uniref:MICAL-like protein 2 n=1 Tax=Triplophysa tibetana TaxID=1572043 RepID=A0A5A9N8F9_9TELE|nr:MICAL-like protein 2 [Triplophysa tibetana]